MTTAFETRLIMPTPADVEVAKASETKILDMIAKKKSPAKYTVSDNRGTSIELGDSVFKVLVEALKTMARGNGVVLACIEKEVTTQQASAILNVSRPFLIGLLDQGKIPFRMVGRYRRIKYEDILEYQAQMTHRRKQAMDELVAQAQSLDMGY